MRERQERQRGPGQRAPEQRSFGADARGQRDRQRGPREAGLWSAPEKHTFLFDVTVAAQSSAARNYFEYVHWHIAFFFSHPYHIHLPCGAGSTYQQLELRAFGCRLIGPAPSSKVSYERPLQPSVRQCGDDPRELAHPRRNGGLPSGVLLLHRLLPFTHARSPPSHPRSLRTDAHSGDVKRMGGCSRGIGPRWWKPTFCAWMANSSASTCSTERLEMLAVWPKFVPYPPSSAVSPPITAGGAGGVASRVPSIWRAAASASPKSQPWHTDCAE